MGSLKERKRKALENLTAALTEAFDVATESGTRHVDERARHVDARFDRLDETLRMMWRQCGGNENQRLPIDD